MNNIMYTLMALAGGVGLSFQAAINSRLSAGLGTQPLVASFISFGIGALCLGLVGLAMADWQSVGWGQASDNNLCGAGWAAFWEPDLCLPRFSWLPVWV